MLGRFFSASGRTSPAPISRASAWAFWIRSPAFWPYVLCSADSITSKYVFRVNGRHIWNPSNFGISAMLFLAPETVATLSIQWGNYLLPMVVIWVLGSVIIWRLRRFHITGIYVVSFIAFAFLRSYITGSPWQSEIAPFTGPMYQLFIFFMITDPKTTVRSKKGQCIVVFLVAFAEFLLRLNQVVRAILCAVPGGAGGDVCGNVAGFARARRQAAWAERQRFAGLTGNRITGATRAARAGSGCRKSRFVSRKENRH